MTRFVAFFYSLVGLGFLMVASLFIYGGFPRTQVVICQRGDAQWIGCQVKQSLAGWVISETRLERLERANSAPGLFDDAETDTAYYRVQLVGADGSAVLEYLSQADADRLAQKIDRFIHDSTDEPLTIRTHYRSWSHVLIGLVVVLAVLALLISAVRSNRSNQQNEGK